jgi:autotransporter passenger strand-loop-strand repeat protein
VTVYNAATVNETTIGSGGKVELHGAASDTTVSSGGTLQLMVGATLLGTTTFSAGATEAIGSGYVVTDLQVGSGLTLEIDGHGSATGSTTVMSGGTVDVRSAGTLNGGTLSGGLIEIMSGGIVGTNEFDFATSAGGTLQLDDSQHFGGVISGFGVPGGIDLRDIAFGTGTMVGYSSNTSSSGVLTVTSGAEVATINLLGQYTAANFNIQTDGHGGTLVTDPPVQGLTGGLFIPHS